MTDIIDTPETAHIQASDRPIIGKHGKPSRAARREANRIAHAQAQVDALARAANPLAAAQENRAAQGLTPVTVLQTAGEKRHEQQEGRQPLVGTGVLSVGRPSEWTDEEGDAICAWIQAGGSLRGYSAQTGRAVQTVYRWMRQDAGFHARYSQAHEDRADTLTDEMLEIADGSATSPSIEGVAAAKLRVEARKWIASKLRPQKWGDKQTVEHVGAVNIRIGIPARPVTVLETVERVG